jgi:hypothetical protein
LNRFRLLFAISAFAALAAALVACGGGGGGGGSADPNKVLDETFSSSNPTVKSGDLDIKLDVDVSGSQGGTVKAELSGPFQSQGSGKVPKLDFDVNASVEGGGQNFDFNGALISTGDAAFVNYKGSDYQVDQSVFDQLKQGIEQAGAQQSQQRQQSTGELLKQLGIKNPKDLLTNLKSEGTADVEGTETDHISGDLNVDKTVAALKNVVASASALGSLGGTGTQLPSASQLDQVKSAIKTAHFDLYSGQDDHILRRLTVTLGIEPRAGSAQGVDRIDLTFDLSIGKVNEPQTITAPSNPKPFSGLLQALGVPSGALGALGAASGGSSSGGGTSGGASAAQAQKYLQCVSQAKTAADLQKCQSLAP